MLSIFLLIVSFVFASCATMRGGIANRRLADPNSGYFDPSSTIRFLEIGDWGGVENSPFTTIEQFQVSAGMNKIGKQIDAQFVIALGDNFYSHGIPTNVYDARFQETWNAVYDATELNIPWYVIAGNHDHRGNVSAQIAYSNLDSTKRWNFPSLYYKKSFASRDKFVNLDIIFMDTTSYTGSNEGDGDSVYPVTVADAAQQAFIENALSTSTADYIIVAGHYPVYSVCEHGNTRTMVLNLKPLLDKYNAHFMSGHDHCAEHIVEGTTSYWLNGMGHGCCYFANQFQGVPKESLKYLMGNTDLSVSIDDNYKEEVGIDGTTGGFTGVIATKNAMTVVFYNQDGTVLYSSSVPNRYAETPSDRDSTIRFLELGDWGGEDYYSNPPTTGQFSNPSQRAIAIAMGQIASFIDAQFVIGLGDNFYHYGISTFDHAGKDTLPAEEGTCFSTRFHDTWESIYTAESLQVPWYLLAGNHDHRGNVSAQIAYSELNDLWNFPSLYYTKTFYSNDKSVSLDIIFMDSTSFTGINSGNVYPASTVDPVQLEFIRNALSSSTADHILLTSHYPVYSVCNHGNTLTLVNEIAPLLEKYNAHFFSGHDHCFIETVVNKVHYWLNGAGQGCCYQSTNMKYSIEIPGSLRFLISDIESGKIDDDGYEVGVDGTVGGFSTIIASKAEMKVVFYNQDAKVLYTTSVPSRYGVNSNNDAASSSSSSSSKTQLSSGAIFGIVVVCIAALIALAVAAQCVMGNSKGESSYQNDDIKKPLVSY